MTNQSNAFTFAPLVGETMLAIYDDGGGVSCGYNCVPTSSPAEPNMSNLGFKRSNADGSWPGVLPASQGPGDGQVFASSATINQNDWCLAPLNSSTVYAFRRNVAGTGFDAASYSAGTNHWSPMTVAPPALGAGQAVKGGAGVFCANDGTRVWVSFVNNDAANTLLYARFDGISWTAWGAVPGTDS